MVKTPNLKLVYSAFERGWVHFYDPKVTQKYQKLLKPLLITQTALVVGSMMLYYFWIRLVNLFSSEQSEFSIFEFMSSFKFFLLFIPDLTLRLFQSRVVGSRDLKEGVFMNTIQIEDPKVYNEMKTIQPLKWHKELYISMTRFIEKFSLAIIIHVLGWIPIIGPLLLTAAEAKIFTRFVALPYAIALAIGLNLTPFASFFAWFLSLLLTSRSLYHQLFVNRYRLPQSNSFVHMFYIHNFYISIFYIYNFYPYILYP